MKYDVYLGSSMIYGVTDVSESASRKIDIYNGVEQGNFTVAGDKELSLYEVSCELTDHNDRHLSDWTAAKMLFSAFEGMMESGSPKRLVMTSDHNKISVLVLLESYTKTEKFAGVYEVKLKFTEYKEGQVRTADIPTITRPGKMPEPPKTAVFGSAKGVAQDAQKRFTPTNPQKYSTLSYMFSNQYGSMVTTNNPNMVPLGVSVTVDKREIDYRNTPISTTIGAWFKTVQNDGQIIPTFDEMDKALREYKGTKYK